MKQPGFIKTFDNFIHCKVALDHCSYIHKLKVFRPNLKNLSRGLNLRCCSNINWFLLKLFVFLMCQDLSRHWIETDSSRGSNSWNSDFGQTSCEVEPRTNFYSSNVDFSYLIFFTLLLCYVLEKYLILVILLNIILTDFKWEIKIWRKKLLCSFGIL